MNVIKKGTPEWEKLNKASSRSYSDRLDYSNIKEQLQAADDGDFVTIKCDHTHHSNLIKGLSRRGLNHKEDYITRLSKDSKDNQVILLSKPEQPSA